MAEPPRIADLGHTRLDLDRTRRTGMPEAVYAAGKSVQECVDIVEHLLAAEAASAAPIIVTRATDAQLEALAPLAPTAVRSRTLTWRHAPARDLAPVAVVSGGTSDRPVVDEAVGTLAALGVPTRVLPDVGVAGLHRLLGSLDELADTSVVVAVAGMEGALPTVLAGLIPQPLIAVPTSVGYGASFDGLAALLSSLASCAPGISVVGIDNGFGAACAALRIVGPGAPR
jgi:pyridinium-3,5-biscarboxylic acid mononucleotide synthase